MTRGKTCLVVMTALAALLSAAPARAQRPQGTSGTHGTSGAVGTTGTSNTAGTISGVVRDSSGATLPGVAVSAINQTSGVAQNTTTGNDGSYTFALPSGAYNIAASLAGFRKSTQAVEVSVGTSREIDFSLQVMLSQEVTVTAMKREESLIDVPFSVAAPNAEQLRDRGAENLEGVAANVGGFTVQNLGPGQSQVAMRGVSAGQIVRDQPGVKEQVGVYLDESVISLSLFTPDIDLFDTDRVEVLRGPQGTLFGAGSESGTVRYITNQPALGVTTGVAEIEGSTVQNGNQGGNGKFAFNVPVSRTAALRVAAYYDRLPGYIDAVQPNLSVQSHVNDGFRTGVRASMKFAPSDRLSITPRVFYQKNDANGWNRNDIYNILANPFTTTRPAVTLGPRDQFTQLQEKFGDDFTLGDVTADYKLRPDLTLTSVTSYTARNILVVRDAGALTSSITGGSIGLPENVYTLDSPLNDETHARVFTQEVRLSGTRKRVHWLGGAFYEHVTRHYGQNLYVAGFQELTGIPTQGLRAPVDSLFWSDLDYHLNQVAFFGEATVPVTDAFTLTGGLRFYHFGEDKAQIFDGIFANDNNGTALVSQPGTTNANGVAPRVIAAYKLSENVTLNGQISRGFRLGGINDPLNVPLCTPQDLVTFGGRDTWKDETSWDYEGGVKSRLAGGKGAVSVSGFIMPITDLQATVTAGSCSSRLIFNVPSARSQGVEGEFELTPTRHLDLAVSASYDDSKLRSTLTSTAPDGSVSIVGGIEAGRRLPTVPQFQMAGAATYQWEVKQGSMAYVTATGQYIGSRYTQLGDADLGTLNLLSFGASTIGAPLTASVFTYNPLLPAYTIANLRVGLRHARWDAGLFVNNVGNERALLAFDQERGTRARIGYLINQPRSIGVTLRTTF